MLSNLKTAPKVVLVGLVIGAAAWAATMTPLAKYLKPHQTVAVSVPDKIDLPTGGTVSAGAGSVINTAPAVDAGQIRAKILAWNANAGLAYAVGGVDTAPGSLMAKRGLNVNLKREDDYSKMIADLAAFAKDNSQGVHFVVIMGDGYPAFVHGANEALKPFNQSVEVIGGIGYSRGEDKCVIDADADPRGSMIQGVLGDGDINICIKYAADNGIPVNADPKTYDPKAMNFAGVSDFKDAGANFLAGAVVERGGKKITTNGAAIWTPVDVTLATKRGHMKTLASTKEYSWQMAATVIGNKQWMAAHPDVVKNFLAAAFEGGELVRSNDTALLKAGEAQAKIYGEGDATYWAKYFKGTAATATTIALGGSTTSGLADNAFLFGLNGNDNLYKKVYNVYGTIAVKYFPDLLPALTPYDQVVNTKYVEELLASAPTLVKADTPSYTGTKDAVVATKSYSIEFDSGKATFTPKAVAVLNDLLDQVAVSSLNVQVNGHTDKHGTPESNLVLSKARAEAVKKFLMANASKNFPDDRVVTRGYGDTQPIGSDSQNRRVEIVLFSTK